MNWSQEGAHAHAVQSEADHLAANMAGLKRYIALDNQYAQRDADIDQYIEQLEC